jgi:hypothetical protein
MSVSAIRSRFSTYQAAFFAQALRDAAILATGFVSKGLWTSSPSRLSFLPGRQNAWRRVLVLILNRP